MEKDTNDRNFIVNEAENQFELHIGERLAFLEFVTKEDKIYLTHTSVPKSLEGQGIGSELVDKTLKHLQSENAVVVPLCSFVAHYIDNNPEYATLLSDGYQM